MKRLISWMLVLCMALSLVPAGLAEEFFAEESFFDSAAGGEDESLFFEEGFFGDDSLFAVEEEEEGYEVEQDEEDLVEGALETRSIISLFTDQLIEETAGQYQGTWKQAPKLSIAKKSDNAITISWVQEGLGKGDIPKTVKYYLYEVDNNTGVAKQVGNPFGAKAMKAGAVVPRTETGAAIPGGTVSAAGMGGTTTIKKLATGKTYTFFVRAENLTKVKGMVGNNEEYGVSSDPTDIFLPAVDWKTVKNLLVTSEETGKVKVTWKSGDKDSFALSDLSGWAPIGTQVGKKMVFKPTDLTIGAYLVRISAKKGKEDFGGYYLDLNDAGTDNDSFTFSIDENGVFSIEYDFTEILFPEGTVVTYTVEPWKDGVKGNAATASATIMTGDTQWKYATIPVASQTENTDQMKATIAVKGYISKDAGSGKAIPTDFTVTGFSNTLTLSPELVPADPTQEGSEDHYEYRIQPAKKLNTGDYKVTTSGINYQDGEITEGTVSFEITGPVKSLKPVFTAQPSRKELVGTKTKTIKGFVSTKASVQFDSFWTIKPEVEITQNKPGTLEALMEIDTAIPFFNPENPDVVDSANWPDTWTITGFADKQIVLQKSGDTYTVQKGTVLPDSLVVRYEKTGTDSDQKLVLEIEFVSNMKGPKSTFTVQAAKKNGKKTIKGASSGKITYTLPEYWANAPKILEAEQIGSLKAKVKFAVPTSSLAERYAVSGFTGTVTLSFMPPTYGKEYSTVIIDPALNAKVKNLPLYTVTQTPQSIDGIEQTVIEVIGPVKKAKAVTFAVTPQKLNEKNKVIKGTAAKMKGNILADAKSGAMNIRLAINASAKTATVTFNHTNPSIAYFNVSLVKGAADFEDTLAADYQGKSANAEVKPDPSFNDIVYFDNVDLDDAENTYTVFVETYLTDGSRIIDKATSLKPVMLTGNEAVSITAKDMVEICDDQGIHYASGSQGSGATLMPVFILETLGTQNTEPIVNAYKQALPESERQLLETDSNAKLRIDSTHEVNGSTTVIMIAAPGIHTIQHYNGYSWSDPVLFAVYEPINVAITSPSAGTKVWNSVDLTATVTGGSGEYSVDIQNKEGSIGDPINVNTESEGYAEFTAAVPITGADQEVTEILVNVTDKNVVLFVQGSSSTLNGVATVAVEKSVSTADAKGCFTYAIRANKSGEVMVTGYDPEFYDADEMRINIGTAKKPNWVTGSAEAPVVQDWVQLEGNWYKVTEIGANAFNKEAVQAVLTGVKMPNQIEVIGESGFSGCANLATMECFDGRATHP